MTSANVELQFKKKHCIIFTWKTNRSCWMTSARKQRPHRQLERKTATAMNDLLMCMSNFLALISLLSCVNHNEFLSSVIFLFTCSIYLIFLCYCRCSSHVEFNWHSVGTSLLPVELILTWPSVYIFSSSKVNMYLNKHIRLYLQQSKYLLEQAYTSLLTAK